jgi:predicted branched-subunit amino acid permease
MYLNWQIWTIAGVVLGHATSMLEHLGLEFAMAATFTGIVVPMLKSSPTLLSAMTAAAVALLARDMPYKLGLLLAAVAGVAVGVVLERLTGRKDGHEPA